MGSCFRVRIKYRHRCYIVILSRANQIMSVDKSLPPELVERINTSKRRCFSGSGMLPKAEKAYTPASVHTGGWMPYNSITRRDGRFASESRLDRQKRQHGQLMTKEIEFGLATSILQHFSL